MACSLLEWLYYNVTCIVWISNNIHGCCSRVTDSSWWVYKSKKAQRSRNILQSACSGVSEKHTTPLEFKHVQVEGRVISSYFSVLGPLARWGCLLELQQNNDTAFTSREASPRGSFGGHARLCWVKVKILSCSMLGVLSLASTHAFPWNKKKLLLSNYVFRWKPKKQIKKTKTKQGSLYWLVN